MLTCHTSNEHDDISNACCCYFLELLTSTMPMATINVIMDQILPVTIVEITHIATVLVYSSDIMLATSLVDGRGTEVLDVSAWCLPCLILRSCLFLLLS
jgi:hypothetical protein